MVYSTVGIQRGELGSKPGQWKLHTEKTCVMKCGLGVAYDADVEAQMQWRQDCPMG